MHLACRSYKGIGGHRGGRGGYWGKGRGRGRGKVSKLNRSLFASFSSRQQVARLCGRCRHSPSMAGKTTLFNFSWAWNEHLLRSDTAAPLSHVMDVVETQAWLCRAQS